MKKKILSVLLTGAMVLGTLTGCGGGSSDNNGGESGGSGRQEAAGNPADNSGPAAATELTFIFADGDEGAKESMNEIVNRFNEANPDITVTIEPGNGGAYSELLKTKDSVGEFPDVMEMRDTAIYVRAGKLEPLSDDIVSLFKSTTEFDGKVYTAPLAGENTNGIILNYSRRYKLT